MAYAFGKELLDRSKWNLIPVVLPFYALLVGRQGGEPRGARRDERDAGGRRGAVTIWGTLALMTIGLFLVYLVTPRDIDWHLRTSVDRVLLALWPSVLLAMFLTIGSPAAAESASEAGAKIRWR